jgi:hypothetical protein
MDPPSQATIQALLFDEWVGPWVARPKDEKDRVASQLAKASIKFTKSGSFISPVAVAAIDILGIKNLLTRMSLEEVAERFAEPFFDLTGPAYRLGVSPLSGEELENRGFRRMAGIFSATVSDSIFLARRPDWELGNKSIAEAQAVVALAECVCKVIKINSNYGIPLRAAVAFGECLVSVGERHAPLGLAIGEASAWERGQEWIGGMLTPSATAVLRQGALAAKQINGADFNPAYPNTLVRYRIPLKPTCAVLPEPQIALNWITGTIAGTQLFDAIVPPPPSDTLPPDVRLKHKNTIAFAERCQGVPLNAPIDWGSIPIG